MREDGMAPGVPGLRFRASTARDTGSIPVQGAKNSTLGSIKRKTREGTSVTHTKTVPLPIQALPQHHDAASPQTTAEARPRPSTHAPGSLVVRLGGGGGVVPDLHQQHPGSPKHSPAPHAWAPCPPQTLSWGPSEAGPHASPARVRQGDPASVSGG